MTKEVMQQALDARYVLTKANLDDLINWLRVGQVNRAVIALEHLNPAIAQPEQPVQPECSTDPDAPHGFDRNGSHNNGRYTCDCEGWTPQPATVNMSSIAQYKLDALIKEGYIVNGYAIERHDGDLVSRGFITEGGMVCWWHDRDDEPMGEPAVSNMEIVGYQYQWTNPADDPDLYNHPIEWQAVIPARGQTEQSKVDELLAHRYAGKPVYRVRALYTPKEIT